MNRICGRCGDVFRVTRTKNRGKFYCPSCVETIKAVRANPMAYAEAGVAYVNADSGYYDHEQKKYLMFMAIFHPEKSKQQVMAMMPDKRRLD